MTINPILLYGQDEKRPEIYSDYHKIKQKVSGNSEVVFEGVPVYGRVNSLPEKLDKKDYTPAMGLVTLAVLNGPEDIRDVMSAYKQIKNGFPKPVSFHSGYDNKKAQHPFSFFRGTVLSEFMNPLSKDCPSPKLAAWLIKQDKTLWDTKLGNWLRRKLGVEEKFIQTSIKDMDYTDKNRHFVEAKCFNTTNPFKNITARAFTRTTKLGALALGGIEAAHVAHEVSNGKNFFEEAGKSAATLGVTLGATGVLGAIGAKHLGPTGSLLGISAGSVAGAITSKILTQSFD